MAEKLTDQERIKAHRQLWNWLADNPWKEKEDWPGWKLNGGEYEDLHPYYCFMCIHMDGMPMCHLCLLEWPENNYGTKKCIDGGLFSQWIDAETDETRINCARQIAELPVKENINDN